MEKLTPIMRLVITVVMIVFIIGLFAFPFFSISTSVERADGTVEPAGSTISLGLYLAFPTTDEIAVQVTKDLKAQFDGFAVNDVVFGGGALLLIAVVTLIIMWLFRNNMLVYLFGLVWGVWGFVGYLTNPVLKLGGGTWTLNVILLIVGAIASAIAVVNMIIIMKNTPEDEGFMFIN